MIRQQARKAVLVAALGAAMPVLVIAGGQRPGPPPEGADASKPFKAGMEARDRGNWAAVVEQMRAAIAIDRKESAVKVGANRILRYGGDPYLPYFFLGEALLKQGGCAGALTAWDESLRQGVVQGQRDQISQLRAGSAQCEADGYLTRDKLDAARADAQTALTSALGAESALLSFANAHADLWPSYRDAYTRVRPAIAGGQARLNGLVAARRGQDLTAFRDGARAAASQLEALLADATRRVEATGRDRDTAGTAIGKAEALERTVDQLIARLSPVPMPPAAEDDRRLAHEKIATAKTRVAENDTNGAVKLAVEATDKLVGAQDQIRGALNAYIAGIANNVRSLGQRARELQRSRPSPDTSPDVDALTKSVAKKLDRARASADAAARNSTGEAAAAADRDVEALHADLSQLERLLAHGPGPAGLVVPANVSEGAQQFFDGHYQQALNVLSDDAIAGADTRLHAPIRALRAAAFFALFEYSGVPGPRDQTLLDRARQEVQRIRQIDPLFEPDGAAFSVRFRNFFHRPDQQP